MNWTAETADCAVHLIGAPFPCSMRMVTTLRAVTSKQLLVKTCKKTKVSCRLGLPDEVMLRQMQKMTERYRNRLLKLKDAKETYRVRHYMNLYDMFRASSAWSIMEVQELLQYVGTVGVAVLC